MTAPNQLNLWMAATTAERDVLGIANGVSPGDFCLVEGTNLYVAETVQANSSTWQPLAGVPTQGPFAVGARNVDDSTNRSVFVMTSVPHRAVLDQPPSSVTLVQSAALQWSTASLFVVSSDVFGMSISGVSDALAPGDNAWWRGFYTISY